MDANAQDITTADDPGGVSPTADGLENIGIDRYMDAQWNGSAFNIAYYTEEYPPVLTSNLVVDIGGDWDFTIVDLNAHAGDELALEWSISAAG